MAPRSGCRFNAAGDDAERAIDDIRHFQQNETFRLLLKDIAGLLPLEILSDHLSALADAVVESRFTPAARGKTARLGTSRRHCLWPLGRQGARLRQRSGPDLLMPDDAVEHRDQLTRVAQRLQSWLTTMTAAGAPTTSMSGLRPDGAAGLLLSTVSAFAEYQRDKAWTWEHQALTRARLPPAMPQPASSLNVSATRSSPGRATGRSCAPT